MPKGLRALIFVVLNSRKLFLNLLQNGRDRSQRRDLHQKNLLVIGKPGAQDPEIAGYLLQVRELIMQGLEGGLTPKIDCHKRVQGPLIWQRGLFGMVIRAGQVRGDVFIIREQVPFRQPEAVKIPENLFATIWINVNGFKEFRSF